MRKCYGFRILFDEVLVGFIFKVQELEHILLLTIDAFRVINKGDRIAFTRA